MSASWSLAHNLQVRHDMILAVYPHMVIGEIGDPAHAAEKSDHNKDARAIVHAEDIMTETDAANSGAAAIILAWLLSDVTDLQYVIHDRRIYGRNEANGWKGAAYTGSDPHTNHIHVSSKHGATGKNTATGTGYDTTAEAYTPAVSLIDYMEATMPLNAADIAAIWAYKLPGGETARGALQDAAIRAGAITNVQMPALTGALTALQTGLSPAAITAAIKAAFPAGLSSSVTAEAVGEALHAELVASAKTTADALAAK